MSVYTSDMYAFLIHIRFVRSAYYYVAKCWRAPRTYLQTCQTALPGFTFYVHALFIVQFHYGCAYRHPEAV